MTTKAKPEPIERFPLNPRVDGRFQKRINGRLYYFGSHGNRADALLEYDRVKRDLYAGRRPRSIIQPGTVTIKEVCNLFIEEQIAREKSGDITHGHLRDYEHAMRRFLKRIGPSRIVDDLGPDDFAEYGRHLRGKAKLGPYAFNRERACLVAMFNHAEASGWIDRAVRMGRGFDKISAAELREIRKHRLISGADMRKLIDKASIPLKVMILLGINGGLGATDIATLKSTDIDLNKGQLLAIRRKRKTLRAVPLWPETIKCLNATEHGDGVFQFPGCATESAKVSWVIKRFTELLGVCQITVDDGVSFGVLRHTFATHANAARDPYAVKRLMGHRLPGLSDVYVEDIDWKRLKVVTDHVRRAIGYPQSDRSRRTA